MITTETALVENILSGMRNVLPQDRDFIPLHEPSFEGNEKAYVTECIETGWVSSVGKFVDSFELKLAEFCETKKAVAVANGTAALHICLLLSGVKDNDEVLCPSLTFVATANAISYCHAIPHFIDSEMTSLGVCADKLDAHLKEIAEIKNNEAYNKLTGRRIGALIVMHCFGHPVDLDKIIAVCEKYHIPLVEDAAESLGSYYKGVHTGNVGIISSLSFNGNKTITTGGGGAIITNDEALGKLAKHITTTAKLPHKWEFKHDMVAYNYRMPNLNAALGLAQMEMLPSLLDRKRILANKYKDAFAGIDGVRFFDEPGYAKSNFWLNLILLDKENAGLRDSVLAATNDNGMMTRPAWTLMHKLPMYSHCPTADVSVAEELEARLINIPSSANLV